MSSIPAPNGELRLGHILEAAGVSDPTQLLVIRHTYTEDGLTGDATPDRLLAYTREQSLVNKVPQEPPTVWLVFMADGGRRSRFVAAYENHGEVRAERTESLRYFDLRPSDLLDSLRNRLVVEWPKDTVNWAKAGATAAAFPLVEIADPGVVSFPGLDNVHLSHRDLQTMVVDPRYSAWWTALGAVQGIYLIADSSTGRLYVGKADGGERILGRWTAYAKDGHGGNTALRDLAGLDSDHCQHFVYSILRVFGPNATAAELDQAESYYKKALLTREHGLNRN